jgi:hypothetical protein
MVHNLLFYFVQNAIYLIILSFSVQTMFSKTMHWNLNTHPTKIKAKNALKLTKWGWSKVFFSGFGGLGVNMLASGTQVCGFEPSWSRRIFQGKKILTMPSFRGEVKPLVPSRRFAACKKSLQIVWNSLFDGKINRIFLAHSSPFPC